MIRFFYRINLTYKFIFFLVAISVLPLIAVAAISFRVAQTILREETGRSMSTLVENQKDYLDLQLGQGENLIANISSIQQISDTLATPAPPGDLYGALAAQASIGSILSGYTSPDGLVSIDLFDLAGTHYHAGDTLDVSAIHEDLRSRFYQKALSAGKPVTWLGIEENINANSGYAKVITAASLLTRSNPAAIQPRPVALLLLNYSVDSFYNHFSRIDPGKRGYLMLVDSSRRIIYHPRKSLIGAEISSDFAAQMAAGTGSFEDTINNEAVIVTYTRSDISGWTIISFIPLNTLMAGTVPIAYNTLAVLAVSGVAVALFSLAMQQVMVKPLREVTSHFRRFEQGTLDFSKRLPVPRSQDEIGDLVHWFNTFLDSLQARREVETALLESEERYSLALRGSNDGIWDWDLRANTVHFSARWKEMLGCREEQIGSDPREWFSRVHPHERERLAEDIQAHLDGRTERLQNEHRLLMADGVTYRWFLALGLAVRDGAVADGAVKDGGQKAHRMAGSLTDITARRDYEDRLTYDAMHDSLTNLANRGFFIAQLKRSIEQARRHAAYHGAVVFMDLDRFKIINDGLGHVSGDQLLIAIAERLRACLRGVDTIARFGGDEFVILLDDISGVRQAEQIADRIQESLAQPFTLESHEVFMTASIGIAMITSEYFSPEDVLRDADSAMYRAKAAGRARFELFDANMHADNLTLLRLEADLRRAIERQEFRVMYQPIIALGTGTVVGAEALLRWAHPERGLISPDKFIQLAEDTGMILPIGEWVLATACAEMQSLRESGLPDLYVSVNISARQVQSQDLPALVESVLGETSLPGRCLELEITENAVMADVAQSTQVLNELKALDVEIAVDDFGTSYSSLNYLKRFPVDVIKIDRSFIQECANDSDDAAITSAIIAMGHILGMRIIAEGVETTDQMAFLHAHQCDFGQGFLVSRPIPLAQLRDLLHSMPVLCQTSD